MPVDRPTFTLTLAVTASLIACGGGTRTVDAGRDAGRDGGRDAGSDAGRDAGADAGALPACGTSTPLALSQCVERARYEADLVAVAMERDSGSAHWQVVQDLGVSRLESLGFTVERHDYGSGINVVGVRLGSAMPERQVLVGAHYDHIAGCAGADDNATGVAGALEAARVLAMASYPSTLVVALWDEEEDGLVGSRAYAARARAGSETIADYFNFEMIGYKDDAPNTQRLPAGFDLIFPEPSAELRARENRADFVAVLGDPASAPSLAALEATADRIGLPLIAVEVPASLLGSSAAGDIRRSDHAAFWDEGYPGILITDTSEFRYDAYHCRSGPDVPANLDHEFATQIVRITVAASATSLGL